MKIREYIQVRYTGIIPDSAINPEKLQIQLEVDSGQVVTLPTLNNFSYYNTSGNYVASVTLAYNYNVEWGDGVVTNGITTYNSASRTHTYVNGGTYLLQISGVFPCWDTNNDVAIKGLVTRVVSWGNTGLKKINFYGCSALTRLPSQTNKLTSVLTFQYFCFGCSALTVIPDGTFFGCSTVGDLSYLFSGCSKLRTLPELLFRDCINVYSFAYTFRACTKLEAIPALLFSTCVNVRSFVTTFRECTTITLVPTGLFTYSNVASCDYQELFYGCFGIVTLNPNIFANTSATGCNFNYTFYNNGISTIPAGFFDNIKISAAANTFANCSNLTTIPEYLFRYQNLCTTFNSCFYYCAKLTGVPTGCFDLNVAGVNVCTSMQTVFSSCGGNATVTVFTIANNVFDQLNKVTTFSNTFGNCSKLEVIPSGLFVNCIAVTDFNNTFQSTKISAIPSGLFSTCTEVVSFLATFASCVFLTSAGIPANIFQNCTKAKYFGYSNADSSSYYNYGVFCNCSNAGFTYIPAGLFDSCVNAESFYGAFYGTKITTIPIDLLRYCTATTIVAWMFASTAITSLSANVLQYNRSITSVINCFYGCTSLISIDENIFNIYNSNPNAIVDFTSVFSNCTNVGLTSIPENLFRYSVNAKKFNSAFSGCTKITSIPAGLFQYNTIAEDFTSCFQSWTVTSIPATLFAGLTQIKTLTNCFYFCHELLTIPATLFDSQGSTGIVTYTSCFRVTGTGVLYNKITSAVPALWLKPNSPVGTACFLNRTAVSNYASIPVGWK